MVDYQKVLHFYCCIVNFYSKYTEMFSGMILKNDRSNRVQHISNTTASGNMRLCGYEIVFTYLL